MKRVLLITLALLIAAGCGTSYALKSLAAGRDDVSFELTEYCGDPSAADGLSLGLAPSLYRRLTWESSVSFEGGEPKAATRTLWNGGEIFRTGEPGSGAVILAADATQSLNMIDDGSGSSVGLTRAMEDLLAQTEPGSQSTKTIRLADYYNCYPVMVSVTVDGLMYISDLFADGRRIMDPYYSGADDRKGKEIADFFSIPVLEDQYFTLTASKDAAGGYAGGSIGSGAQAETSGIAPAEEGDSFYLHTQSISSGSRIWLWFSNLTEGGKRVDTSLIPGGYGIYSVDYALKPAGEDPDARQLDLGSPELFFSLDEKTDILSLNFSSDKSRLLLLTCENGGCCFTLINAANGKQLQKLRLCEDFTGSGSWCYARAENDCELVFLMDDDRAPRVMLIAKGEDGLWSVRIDETHPDGDIRIWEPVNLTNRNLDWAYDGERLILAGPYMITSVSSDKGSEAVYFEGGYGCGFSISVYGPEGRRFSGHYKSSLDYANELYKRGDPRRWSMSDYAQPDSFGSPVKVLCEGFD